MNTTAHKRTLIVGNWKMNLNTHQSSVLVHRLSEKVDSHQDVQTILCPSVMTLQSLSLQINHRQFKLGAQNCYWRDDGAFTGEVSANMLRGLVDYVLVGHSERRHIFGEQDRDIRHKVQAAFRNDIRPILCIGETAQERTDRETHHVLHDQIVSGLLNVTSEEVSQLVIAYEPVWAIGTGASATAKDLIDAEQTIRKQIWALYGAKAASEVTILYGGSVSAENCEIFLNVPGVDGLLVGGASLKAEEFASIVEKAHNSRKQKG